MYQSIVFSVFTCAVSQIEQYKHRSDLHGKKVKREGNHVGLLTNKQVSIESENVSSESVSSESVSSESSIKENIRSRKTFDQEKHSTG